jgi:hypothetical protein
LLIDHFAILSRLFQRIPDTVRISERQLTYFIIEQTRVKIKRIVFFCLNFALKKYFCYT